MSLPVVGFNQVEGRIRKSRPSPPTKFGPVAGTDQARGRVEKSAASKG